VRRPLHTFAGFAVVLAVSAAQPALGSLHQSEEAAEAERVEKIIFSLPKPPAVGGLVGLRAVPQKGRSRYLPLVTREAERWGLPTAVADAVVMVESAYDPSVVGTVGELGLMQVRPGTAAMLGFTGSNEALADPETNIRYGVEYLAKAWRLAGGDVCRALMKYRAGHGEERMTPRSVEYCRRARIHLATVGSPLADEEAALAAGLAAPPMQVAPSQPVQPRRDPRAAEEQRRAALQRELVRRFILTVARVGSTGRTEPLKPAGSPSQVRQADGRQKGASTSARR
jgi:Transglycosylase SLT domain